LYFVYYLTGIGFQLVARTRCALCIYIYIYIWYILITLLDLGHTSCIIIHSVSCVVVRVVFLMMVLLWINNEELKKRLKRRLFIYLYDNRFYDINQTIQARGCKTSKIKFIFLRSRITAKPSAIIEKLNDESSIMVHCTRYLLYNNYILY